MTTPATLAKHMVRVCEKVWKKGDEALRLTKDAQSPLRARSYSAGRKSKGVIDNQTMDVGCARVERDTPHRRLVEAMEQLEIAALKVERLVDEQFIVGDKAKARKRGSGNCVACGEWVPGEGEDRIKSGMCPADYQACHRRIRKDAITRSEYVEERRRETGYRG